jgi:mannosyltransferase
MLETYFNQDVHLLYSGYNKNIFLPEFKGEKIVKNNYLALERYKNIKMNETDPFIFHSSYYRYCKNKNAINVTTVHDFIYELFCHDIKANVHKIQKKTAILHSEAIICNSENTKKDFMSFFPDYNGIVKVVYLGLSGDYYHRNKQRENKVIFIGGRRGYKNFKYAIMLMQKLRRYRLQIVGGGPLGRKELGLLNMYIPGNYEYYKSLSNSDLNIKYNEAQFLLYPSLYEGFGVPVVEAQAAGCPVVCCDVSSLPEVAGGAAVYISGKDIDDDIKKIVKLDDQNYYNSIVQSGFENCKKFSWEKCAKETYDFYKEIYELKKAL